MTSTPDLSTIAKELTKFQSRFIRLAGTGAHYPADINVTGSVCAALVRKGLAYRSIAHIRGQKDGAFNVYGLTPLGTQLLYYLKEQAR